MRSGKRRTRKKKLEGIFTVRVRPTGEVRYVPGKNF
jgi:hypothetical protein